jgi:hypothetical protein
MNKTLTIKDLKSLMSTSSLDEITANIENREFNGFYNEWSDITVDKKREMCEQISKQSFRDCTASRPKTAARPITKQNTTSSHPMVTSGTSATGSFSYEDFQQDVKQDVKYIDNFNPFEISYVPPPTSKDFFITSHSNSWGSQVETLPKGQTKDDNTIHIKSEAAQELDELRTMLNIPHGESVVSFIKEKFCPDYEKLRSDPEIISSIMKTF